MSWIIQSLLNNKNIIKETMDIESTQYNDLILVEKSIQKLSEKGLLSPDDMDVIDEMTGDVFGFHDRTSSQKETVVKKYNIICERIAFYMGDYFTDEGYLCYMQETYNLTEAQVEILRSYIKSRFRFKTMKKEPSNGY